MTQGKHFYYWEDKSRINWKAVGVYDAKVGFRVRVPHDKRDIDHRVGVRNSESRNGVEQVEEEEVGRVMTELVIQNRYASTTDLKLAMKHRVLGGLGMAEDWELAEQMDMIVKKMYFEHSWLSDVTTISKEKFGRNPLMYYNPTTKEAEKVWFFYSSSFQKSLISKNVSLYSNLQKPHERYQMDLIHTKNIPPFPYLLCINIHDHHIKSPIPVFFCLLPSLTKVS
jgi:hypothetical protein